MFSMIGEGESGIRILDEVVFNNENEFGFILHLFLDIVDESEILLAVLFSGEKVEGTLHLSFIKADGDR